jgi:hypothetical protein
MRTTRFPGSSSAAPPAHRVPDRWPGSARDRLPHRKLLPRHARHSLRSGLRAGRMRALDDAQKEAEMKRFHVHVGIHFGHSRRHRRQEARLRGHTVAGGARAYRCGNRARLHTHSRGAGQQSAIETSAEEISAFSQYSAARCRRALAYAIDKYGRGERIRTSDILLPKQARYRAALHPER